MRVLGERSGWHYAWLILSFLLLGSCEREVAPVAAVEPAVADTTSVPPAAAVDQVHQIDLATGGCEGVCPARAFQVDRTLVLRYVGDKIHAKPSGYQEGGIDSATWSRLVRSVSVIDSIGVPAWQLTYDCPEYELVVVRDEDTLHVRGCSEILGPRISGELATMIKLIERVPLRPSKEKFKPLTRVQGPIDDQR